MELKIRYGEKEGSKMAKLYATCPNCGGQHMYHDQEGYNQWFCWHCDTVHENDDIRWVAERSDNKDYSLTYRDAL